jgi:N-acetylated-alpha-linked acidic dipeptidase
MGNTVTTAARLLSLSILVQACQHEHASRLDIPRHLLKRQSDYPPVLDAHESILVNSFDNNTISDWSYYYTHGLHVAGTNRSDAQWTADRWSENGIPSHLEQYWVYLNYPLGKSLTLTYPNGTVWTPNIEEDVLSQDETTSYPNRVPTFHGYSASGNASAEYVYVG